MAARSRAPEPSAPATTDPCPGETAPVAVIDIGSNSVRLVVYDRGARAPLPRFNEKAFCRLGEGLERTGAIAAEPFARVVQTMGRFRAICDGVGVARVAVLATEALRTARNGPALAQAIEAESGFAVRALSGAEEARYAALGVVSGFYRPTGMVGDMGGGSVEVAEVVDDRVGERHVSLPLGALPVTAMFDEDAKAAKHRIDAMLHELLPPLLTTEATFYAVGGGWRALAKAHMAATGAPVRVVHGYALPGPAARAFAKRIRKQPTAALAALPNVSPRRAPTLAAAALVLERVLKCLKPDRVVFSALGLREGWLYDQLSDAERARDPLVEAARDLGATSARVPAFAAALVRWTDGFFPGETPADLRLRAAVCALTDIAWRDHADLQAGEAFRRLLQFPFVGVEHADRVFLAAAIHARYGGSPGDPAIAPALALLTPSRRRRALILGRLLLLGHRLSACVPELLDTAHVRVDSDRVRLVVGEATRLPDGEAVQGRLELLAKAIGVAGAEIVTGRRRQPTRVPDGAPDRR